MSFLTAGVLHNSSICSLFWSQSCPSFSIPLSLSFSPCVVTRGIMGLSNSRQDADALNSNIKWFPVVPGMSSSLPFSCLTGRAIHASYAKLFSPSSSPFFLPTKAHATPSCSAWSRCHHPSTSLSCGIRPCFSRWCVCTHTSSETLSTPTMHYHNAIRSVKKAHCNVKRKLPLVEFSQTDQK